MQLNAIFFDDTGGPPPPTAAAAAAAGWKNLEQMTNHPSQSWHYRKTV
jgi:hypothetical protein